MTVPLFYWPERVRPSRQIVSAVGNTTDGFISRSSYENDLPISGARNQLRLAFGYHQSVDAAWAAWIIQNLRRGWFSVPLLTCPQLCNGAALVAAEAAYAQGLPFSTEEYFSTGYGFRFNPTVDVSTGVLEGNSVVVLDESRYPDELTHGKIFGMGRAVYHVNEIERDGDLATVTFSPPARRDIEVGEEATLRPSLICKPADVSSFINAFEPADLIQPGELVMNEVVDAAYL